MDNLNLDKYLEIVYGEKEKIGLKDYIPLFPMLRVQNDKLYVCTALVREDENVWDFSSKIKPKYWTIIDPTNIQIKEFNNIEVNDFVENEFIEKNIEDKQAEKDRYIASKIEKYKKLLVEDIKSEKTNFENKLSEIVGDTMTIDGEEKHINDFLVERLEEDITNTINELGNILLYSKYGSITFYYTKLFREIIAEYISNGNINKEKMKICIEIMNNYYEGIIGIDNIFNI